MSKDSTPQNLLYSSAVDTHSGWFMNPIAFGTTILSRRGKEAHNNGNHILDTSIREYFNTFLQPLAIRKYPNRSLNLLHIWMMSGQIYNMVHLVRSENDWSYKWRDSLGSLRLVSVALEKVIQDQIQNVRSRYRHMSYRKGPILYQVWVR